MTRPFISKRIERRFSFDSLKKLKTKMKLDFLKCNALAKSVSKALKLLRNLLKTQHYWECRKENSNTAAYAQLLCSMKGLLGFTQE